MSLNSAQIKQLIIETPYDSLQYLRNVLLFNMQDNENETAIVQGINSLLSSAVNREKGLELLILITNHCSLDMLTEHSINWAAHCIIRHSTDNLKEIKLNTLTKIIENTTEVENFNKKFLSDYLLDTLKTCLGCSSYSEKIAALKCLTQCMKRFPSWFTNHKQKVEPFLLSSLESSVKVEVKEAAFAFLVFQQSGGAGVDAVNYVNNFALNFKKLCKTVHSLYNTLFEGVNEIDNSDKIECEPFAFNVLPPNYDSIKIQEKTATRIVNVLTFLKTMVVKQFSVPKQLIPKHIIDVINRGLCIHVCLVEQNLSMMSNYLSLQLNNIQIELMQLLRVVMIGYMPSILPFTHVLSKLLLNVLKRTQNCPCLTSNQAYKKCVYKIFLEWLNCTKCGNLLHLQESLIPLLLKDITPVKKTVLLNTNVTNKGKKGKIIQKQNASIQDNTTDRILYNVKNVIKETACTYALDILQALLNSSILKASTVILQELTQTIIQLLADIQAERVSAPYTNTACQIKLYNVLISLFNQNNLSIFVSIHLAIKILLNGVNHVNYKISSICTSGLNIFEKICHPVCPSLYLSTATQDSNKKVINSSELVVLNSEETTNKNNTSIESAEIYTEDGFQNLQEDIEETNPGPSINIIEDITVTKEDITVMSKQNGVSNDSTFIRNKEVEAVIDVEDSSDSVSEVPLNGNYKESEEPPEKRQKIVDTVDNDIDDMFNSFQDVIQE